jgi:hypothetical protein
MGARIAAEMSNSGLLPNSGATLLARRFRLSENRNTFPRGKKRRFAGCAGFGQPCGFAFGGFYQ